jgi:hypothetical protein
VGVAVHIQTETRGVALLEGHLLHLHIVLPVVVDLEITRGGAHLREDCVKRHRVARKIQFQSSHRLGRLFLTSGKEHWQNQCPKQQAKHYSFQHINRLSNY